MTRQQRVLTLADKEMVFKTATKALPQRYADKISSGMTDEELRDALVQVLGIFGGSCGPERLDVLHQASGLKIWGGWHIVNHVIEKPLYQGAATLTMARMIYGIKDPEDPQMKLF